MNDVPKAAKPLLPFTRPTHRRGDHRSRRRGAALRVARQRTEGGAAGGGAVALLRRPPGAQPDLGHRGAGDGAAGLRHRAGRRGHHPGAEFRCHRERHHARGCAPGVRRRRARLAQYRPRPGRGGASRRAPAPSCRCTLPACRSTWSACTHIAAQHRLRVIEDAAHAIGSAWRGRRIGSFGDLVCFSFHPNKNMTTIEGGAISGGSRRGTEVDRAAPLARPGQVGPGRLRYAAARGQVEPLGRRRRRRPRAAAAPRGIQRPAARAGRALLRAVGHGGAAAPAGARRRRATAGTCSRRCCRCRSCAITRARVHGGHEGARHRRRRALPGDPPVQLLPRARLPRRPVPERRAHRARDRDAAAVPGDAARATSIAWSRRRTRSSPERADEPGRLGRHPGLQRGGGPAAAVRAAVPGARCPAAHLRGGVRR